MSRLFKAAVIAAVALDFLTPTLGTLQAQAQSSPPASGDAFRYQSQLPPAPDMMIVDQLGRSRLQVNSDGSISTRIVGPVPVVQFAASCPAVNNQAAISVTPPAGQYAYIVAVQLSESADSTGGTPDNGGAWNVINMAGGIASTSYFKGSFAGTASTSAQLAVLNFSQTPWKSGEAGIAFQFKSPSALLHTAFCETVWYYLAP